MVRRADTDTFNSIHSFNSGMKNFFFFRLGKNLRLVLALECDTELPNMGLLPVNSHTLLIAFFFGGANMKEYKRNSKPILRFTLRGRIYIRLYADPNCKNELLFCFCFCF